MIVPYDQLLVFLFLMARTSGIFVFTPFFGSLNVPVQVRILLTVAMSYLFALGFKFSPQVVPDGLVSILVGLAEELIIGMAIGFAAQILFAGLEYAGQIIGFQIGLSLVNMIDPQTANRSSTLSVWQTQLGLMLFLGLNAHHWFIQAIADSLTSLPPYSLTINHQFILKLTEMTAQIFVIGFQIAAPVTAVLILTDIAIGFISRSAPQIQIMVIGFPLKVLVGISALGLGLYFFPAAMRIYTTKLHSDMASVIQLLRR